MARLSVPVGGSVKSLTSFEHLAGVSAIRELFAVWAQRVPSSFSKTE